MLTAGVAFDSGLARRSGLAGDRLGGLAFWVGLGRVGLEGQAKASVDDSSLCLSFRASGRFMLGGFQYASFDTRTKRHASGAFSTPRTKEAQERMSLQMPPDDYSRHFDRLQQATTPSKHEPKYASTNNVKEQGVREIYFFDDGR